MNVFIYACYHSRSMAESCHHHHLTSLAISGTVQCRDWMGWFNSLRSTNVRETTRLILLAIRGAYQNGVSVRRGRKDPGIWGSRGPIEVARRVRA